MKTTMIERVLCAVAALSLASGCGFGEAAPEEDLLPDDQTSSLAAPPTPEIPAIARDVHLVEQMKLTQPYLPALRTTADGRLGVVSKVEPGDGPNLLLLTPEKIQTSFQSSAPGATVITDGMQLDLAALRGANTQSDSHIGLCDSDRNGQGNPYLCPDNAAEDCYDVTIVQTSISGTKDTLWGTPVTIHVANPKTPSASIARLDHGIPVKGTTFPFALNRLLEISFAGDGHLFLARLGNALVQWKNSSGVTVTTNTDIAYFAGDPGADPCDVRQFKTAAPLSHAPNDPAVNKRYGFAMQPFRDPMGNKVPDGAELGVTYPWMDRSGDNVLFTAVNTTLFNKAANGVSTSKYPASCLPSGCDFQDNELGNIEDSDGTRGKTIVGLWTNGKMVTMDNLVNNTDFGLHVDDGAQRMVKLYQPGTAPGGGGAGTVRVGSGRDNRKGQLLAGGSLGNITFVDSVENRYNWRKQLRPATPRDVVWKLSSGVTTDEFAFDDHVNPDALIVSSMVQAIDISSGNKPIQHNGIATTDVQVQNAATSRAPRWIVPSAGVVTNGRIEPTATGGIEGKGLWLNGDGSFVTYKIPAQPASIRSRSWNVGLFLDARFPDAAVRTLIQFPDASELQLRGRSQLLYFRQGGVVRTVTLPETMPLGGWAHIGLQMSNQNKHVDAYLNGYRFDSFDTATPIFELSAGDLVVGDAAGRTAAGFRGWIDELKVFAQPLDPEVACNLAKGTLVAITSSTSTLAAQAQQYPKASHDAITAKLSAGGSTTTAATYACCHNYRKDLGASVSTIPAGTASIRDDLLFPEGPLDPELPRPDSTHNAFCLSCHTAESKAGLGLAALVFRPGVPQRLDTRRMPMQPSARVFGNIPANWLAVGVPASALAPVGGTSLDRLLAQ